MVMDTAIEKSVNECHHHNLQERIVN